MRLLWVAMKVATHFSMRKTFLTCTRGATAIEYGLICALIFLALIGGMSLLGNESTGLFGKTNTAVSDAMR